MKIIYSFCGILHRTKTLASDMMSTQLTRFITTPELILFGIGTMASSGIYVLSGTVEKNIAGPATFISYIIAGIAAMVAAVCYAEMSARIPRAGSSYLFTYVTMGEFWAFFVGWNMVLEYTIGTASIAAAWSGTIDHAFLNDTIKKWIEREIGAIHVPYLNVVPNILGAAVCIIISMLIACGVRLSMKLTSIFTFVNICIMSVTIGMGFHVGNIQNLVNPDGHGFLVYGVSGVISGASTVFYAFVGFDCMAMTSEEVKHPATTIPVSIMVAMVIVTVMYVLMSIVLAMLQPFQHVSSTAAFPMAFGSRGIIWVKYLVGIGSLLGMTTSLIGLLYSLPRVIYAMANDGLFFKIFGKVHQEKHTPFLATLVFGFLAALMALLFDLEVLAEFLSLGTLMAYCMVAASVIVLRYQPDTHIPKSVDEMKLTPSENIGKIRWRFKCMSRLSRIFNGSVQPGHLVIGMTITMVFVMLGIAILCFRYPHTLTESWSIIILTIMCLIVLFCIGVISVHEQNANFSTFKVPLVPVVPAISIFLDLCLMVSLSPFTWVRLAVWMGIGFFIYFLYGIRHSVEGRKTNNIGGDEAFPFSLIRADDDNEEKKYFTMNSSIELQQPRNSLAEIDQNIDILEEDDTARDDTQLLVTNRRFNKHE